MAPTSVASERVGVRTWTVVFLMSMSWALSFYPILVFQAIGAPIAEELGQASLAAWFIPSALLPAAVLNLTTGATTDLFGRRAFIVAGAGIVTVGLIAIAATQTAPGVVGGMVVLGIGSALAQISTFAIAELLPNKWRHIAAMLSESCVLVENLVAPVTGRYSLASGTWRWQIGTLAICEFLVFVGLALLYFPPAHPSGMSRRQLVKELDYAGMFLYTAGAVTVLLGIVWAGTYPSGNSHVVAPLVIGFALLTGFALYETSTNLKHPITPPHIFAYSRGRDTTAPLITLSMLVFFFYGQAVLWPSMIEEFYVPAGTFKQTWQKAAALSVVQGGGIGAGAWLESAIGRSLRHWKWQLVGGMTMTTLFGALLALANADNKSTAIAIFFLSNVGYGWTFVVNNAVVQLGVPHSELGTIGGLANTARNAGGTISSAVYATILANVVRSNTARNVGEIESYRRGYMTVALASIAFGGFGVLAALCCKDIDKKMDEHIEVHMKSAKEGLEHAKEDVHLHPSKT